MDAGMDGPIGEWASKWMDGWRGYGCASSRIFRRRGILEVHLLKNDVPHSPLTGEPLGLIDSSFRIGCCFCRLRSHHSPANRWAAAAHLRRSWRSPAICPAPQGPVSGSLLLHTLAVSSISWYLPQSFVPVLDAHPSV